MYEKLQKNQVGKSTKLLMSQFYNCPIIIIIIIISIFKEDNVFSITASLPYGPPVNTDIDYYQTFFRTCLFLLVLRG